VNLDPEVSTTPVTFSDIQGGWAGPGNIDADPLFVSRGQWVRPASDSDALPAVWVPGDYHLRSQGWSWDAAQRAWTWDNDTSPCIDAGDPVAVPGGELPCNEGDPLRERAGTNTRINMGAYGGTPEASLAPHGQ
jgi:hypothetical protein